MMFQRRWHWVVFLIFTLMLSACNGTDQAPPDPQLIEVKKQLSDLNTEHQRLAQRCNRIAEQMALLQTAHENLGIKTAELSHWSRQLAQAFGPGIWYFSTDERPLPVKAISDATPEKIIAELNHRFAQDHLPLVVLEKIEGSVAHVQIGDEQQLTQHMGTTGATAYIEVVTYSLTSLKSIGFVEFRFKEGDHAIPGRYSR
jgi:hypothetical protein